MPDMHVDSINAFWDSYDRRTLYRVLVAMERLESWVIDSDPDIDKALIELGNAMDASPNTDLKGIEKHFVKMFANTRLSRVTRIMQTLDAIRPGSASQILMSAEEPKAPPFPPPGMPAAATPEPNQENKLFLDRNMVFERMQLLARVFAPARITLALKTLEYHHEAE